MRSELDQAMPPLGATSRTRRRPPVTRLSGGHLAVVLAGALALLLNLVALRAMDTTRQVLVLATDVNAGQPVTLADTELRELRVADEAALGLVAPDALPDGYVAAHSLRAGGLLTASDLQPPAAPDGLRAMSIPVSPSHAAGGALAAGDLVDLIDVRAGSPTYLATGIEVLATSFDGGGALTGMAEASITVAIDAHTALCIASAIHEGNIEVIRSTGAVPEAAGPCVLPEPEADPAAVLLGGDARMGDGGNGPGGSDRSDTSEPDEAGARAGARPGASS